MTSVVIVRNQGKTPAKDIDVTIKIPTVRYAPRPGDHGQGVNHAKMARQSVIGTERPRQFRNILKLTEINLSFKMVKDDHLLYVVSSKVMTKNHRYECKIKGGDFNMDGLEESRKKKRDISGPEVGSERGLGGVMYDETMRMYVPKVNTFENNWLHQC